MSEEPFVGTGPVRETDGSEQCTVLHVDMDAFFAAVEVLDDPQLAGKPVIVGGSGERGVVASCTYEARAFGVRSAMPSLEAKRRCPQAVFVSGRYWRYAEMSERFHTVLKEFTPLVEGIGLDEAFLDVRGAIKLLGLPPALATSLRHRVREELSMSCAVGVARTKMLAKLGSRAAKPRPSAAGAIEGAGVFVIKPTEESDFLRPMPVRALWGVGPATAARLERVGVDTIGSLAEVPTATLCRLLGQASGNHLAALARGHDPGRVEPDRAAKSIGHEETFATDVAERSELRRHALRMADAVGARLTEAGLWGRTVSVKIRYADRRTITRSHTAGGPLRASHAIAAVAQTVVDEVDLPQGVRLIGVSVSGLEPAGKDFARQLSFASFGEDSDDHETPVDTEDQAWRQIQEAMSAIRARYGQGSVGPAALVGPDGLEAKQRGDTHWGPEAEPVPSSP